MVETENKKIRGVDLDKIEGNIIRLKKEKEIRRPELGMGVVFTVEEDTEGDAENYIVHWEEIVDHVRLQPKLITSPRTEICPEPFGKDYGKLVVLMGWEGDSLLCRLQCSLNDRKCRT